jgi:hypothetical protein
MYEKKKISGCAWHGELPQSFAKLHKVELRLHKKIARACSVALNPTRCLGSSCSRNVDLDDFNAAVRVDVAYAETFGGRYEQGTTLRPSQYARQRYCIDGDAVRDLTAFADPNDVVCVGRGGPHSTIGVQANAIGSDLAFNEIRLTVEVLTFIELCPGSPL